MGNEGFVAPEDVLGRRYDNSIDFASLEVLGYLLTSQRMRSWDRASGMIAVLETERVDWAGMRSSEQDFVGGLISLA